VAALYAPRLEAYLEGLVPSRHPVMREMEERARQTGFPIVGPVVGHLFYQLGRMVGARRVFEMGSGFGYSTAWLALAVRDNGGGEVYHVVWDERLSREARDYLGRLGLLDIVRFRVAEAVSELAGTGGEFDLIFNDIEKPAYPQSLPVIKSRLRRGGLLLVDNMLWSGRVWDEAANDPATQGVREFTRLVFADPDFVASIIPIRDGVLLAWRI
jgi:predicted O-methyltransferase YrrM